MTQEEKARAYDEALERAERILCNIPEGTSTIRDIETIFPELAESEDERIRKDIIRFLEVEKEDRDAPFFDKAIAYLEKQKEQKPADEQFPPLEGLDAIKAKYYDDGLKNGFDEGVESVKPAEWSEEDELMRSACIAFIQDEKFKGYERAYECVDWLKSLRPSWKPSEEQMAALLNIEGDLRAFQHDDKAKIIAELYEQLKRLL